MGKEYLSVMIQSLQKKSKILDGIIQKNMEQHQILSQDELDADAFEKNNSAFLAKGITFNKYTGVRGKSGSNDANAEYIAELRKIMDDANVAYQFA